MTGKRKKKIKSLAVIAMIIFAFFTVSMTVKQQKNVMAYVTPKCTISIKTGGYNDVRIKVSTNMTYDGVVLYRSDKKNGTYKYVGKADFRAKSWFVDNKNLVTNQKYFYRASAYKYNDNGKRQFVLESNIISYIPKMKMPKINSTKSSAGRLATISWGKVPGANGYLLYKSGDKTGKYRMIAEKKGSGNTKYTDNKVTSGHRYYYYIVAYRNVNGKKVKSDASGIKVAKITVPKTTLKSVITTGPTSQKIVWKKIKNVDGYDVFLDVGNKGKYSKIRTYGKNITSCNIGELTNGVFYQYSVRTFKKVNGKKVYGADAENGRYVDYYTYEDESYMDKNARISKGGASYDTREQAEANMITITINVWDFDSYGNKVTKQRSFPVNKFLAPSIMQAFKEIYEGAEQFPIKDIWAYSWRGDNSTSEHCLGMAIDINPDENYMVDGDVAVVGSYWKPHEDPYSIPTDGEVARILRKYGFYQGLWGYRNDYMHFSYFGG